MTRPQELQVVVQIAREAGAIAMNFYGKAQRLLKSHRATQNEAVTEADRACQRLIVSRLLEAFPGDGIIGEESDDGADITVQVGDPDGRVWVIDPIDGTNNFVAGADNFAVCIGLLEAGRPVLGVVYDVTRDRIHAGGDGGLGARVNGRPVVVKSHEMDDAAILMLTSNTLDKDGCAPAWIGRLLAQTNWKVRVLGSAALEAVAVASGVADAAVTVNGKLWDCVAPAAILLAAGGVVCDLRGEPIFPFDLRQYGGAKVPYLAAGPMARRQMLDLILKNP